MGKGPIPRNGMISETTDIIIIQDTGYIWNRNAGALHAHSPSRPKMSLASRFEGNSKVRK
jgi:hypothetical protein